MYSPQKIDGSKSCYCTCINSFSAKVVHVRSILHTTCMYTESTIVFKTPYKKWALKELQTWLYLVSVYLCLSGMRVSRTCGSARYGDKLLSLL